MKPIHCTLKSKRERDRESAVITHYSKNAKTMNIIHLALFAVAAVVVLLYLFIFILTVPCHFKTMKNVR